MPNEEQKSYPAVVIVHTPTGPIPACAHHANRLKALFEFMGVYVIITPVNNCDCINCKNEAELQKRGILT